MSSEALPFPLRPANPVPTTQRGVLVSCVAGSALVALVVPGDARAQAGPSEWSVVSGVGVAAFDGMPPDAMAPLVTGQVMYGVTDTVSLGAQLYAGPSFRLGTLDDATEGRTGIAAGAFAGVGINLDVTRIVPFGSVMAGVWTFGGATDLPAVLPALRIAIGADWRPVRGWAFGAQVEAHVAPTRIDALPSATLLVFRLNRIFDPNAL